MVSHSTQILDISCVGVFNFLFKSIIDSKKSGIKNTYIDKEKVET